jgi:hypothetical protein
VALEPDTTEPEETPAVNLTAGDCVQMPDAYEDMDTLISPKERVPVVPCDEPHDGEVLFLGDAWNENAEYPGNDVVEAQAKERCDNAFESYIGRPFDRSALEYIHWHPVEEGWEQGDREIGCVAYDPAGQLEQSVEDSGR